MKFEHVWAAIIAGGKGTRLFPISHPDCPKQFCQMNEMETFIQATVRRLRTLGITASKIVVITTNSRQLELAKRQLLPLGVLSVNIYQINERFGYAGAMVKAAEFIRKNDEKAVIVNTPADQYIGKEKEFTEVMLTAIREAEMGLPVMVGVKTGDIVTAMGCGHVSYEGKGPIFDKIGDFIEKPDRETAEVILRYDNTACNTGINVWSAKTLLETISSGEIGSSGLATDVLMNRFKKVRVAVGHFIWFDCGTLKAIYDINSNIATPNHKNVSIGSGCDQVDRTGCQNNLFYTINGVEIDATGLENVAVVANNINNKIFIGVVALDQSQKVRDLAEHFADEGLVPNYFTIDGVNNVSMPSNLPRKNYQVGFVGVNNCAVYVHKDRRGDIRVAVSNLAYWE